MDDPMVARVSAAAGVPDLVERLATSVSAGDLEAFLLDLARLTLAAFAGAMVPVIAALALVSDAGSHASDAFFVAGASFVSIAFTILGVAVTTWMVGSAAHELEQWRGRPQP